MLSICSVATVEVNQIVGHLLLWILDVVFSLLTVQSEQEAAACFSENKILAVYQKCPCGELWDKTGFSLLAPEPAFLSSRLMSVDG